MRNQFRRKEHEMLPKGEKMMKKKRFLRIIILTAATAFLTSCSYLRTTKTIPEKEGEPETLTVSNSGENEIKVDPKKEVTKLSDGVSAVLFDGNDGFESFLLQGGASTDEEVAEFLTHNLTFGIDGITFKTPRFGCSSISVKNSDGEALFGRNFDWKESQAMVVTNKTENGYSSVSTVNMDFLGSVGSVLRTLPEKATTIAALYAPVDGMNEKGLCVAVLMIEDSDSINQQTEKADITTTTAVRLLLNKAANVEEAISLLKQYDLHSSMGLMVHFALADSQGRSVIVEYVNNEMIVTETPVATNFYLADSEKNGIGSAQSHIRYEILMERLTKTPVMSMAEVRDALDSVSKDDFGEFESTEWSIVYNQLTREIRYYHREDYKTSYIFMLDED